MYLQITVRFILTLFGSLFGFYLAAILFHAMGYLSDAEIQHVHETFSVILSPIMSLDSATLRTMLVAGIVLLLQALLVAYIFRRWTDQPERNHPRINPAPSLRSDVTRFNTHSPFRLQRAYSGSVSHHAPYEAPNDSRLSAEDRRLLALFSRQR